MYCYHCMNKMDAKNRFCPKCGEPIYTDAKPYHLPPGTILKERYMAGKVLRENAKGIIYLGLNGGNGRRVYLLECLASKNGMDTVGALLGQFHQNYPEILVGESFLQGSKMYLVLDEDTAKKDMAAVEQLLNQLGSVNAPVAAFEQDFFAKKEQIPAMEDIPAAPRKSSVPKIIPIVCTVIAVLVLGGLAMLIPALTRKGSTIETVAVNKENKEQTGTVSRESKEQTGMEKEERKDVAAKTEAAAEVEETAAAAEGGMVIGIDYLVVPDSKGSYHIQYLNDDGMEVYRDHYDLDGATSIWEYSYDKEAHVKEGVKHSISGELKSIGIWTCDDEWRRLYGSVSSGTGKLKDYYEFDYYDNGALKTRWHYNSSYKLTAIRRCNEDGSVAGNSWGSGTASNFKETSCNQFVNDETGTPILEIYMNYEDEKIVYYRYELDEMHFRTRVDIYEREYHAGDYVFSYEELTNEIPKRTIAYSPNQVNEESRTDITYDEKGSIIKDAEYTKG